MLKRKKYREIPVQRQSGLPVKLERLLAYKTEFRNTFDELWETYKSDIKDFQKRVDKLEQDLLEKYPRIDHWNWEISQREWRKLLDEYGPVAIAKDLNGNLVYLIMDEAQ